jgi:hypothetical protein
MKTAGPGEGVDLVKFKGALLQELKTTQMGITREMAEKAIEQTWKYAQARQQLTGLVSIRRTTWYDFRFGVKLDINNLRKFEF